jgi:hypothetical protein
LKRSDLLLAAGASALAACSKTASGVFVPSSRSIVPASGSPSCSGGWDYPWLWQESCNGTQYTYSQDGFGMGASKTSLTNPKNGPWASLSCNYSVPKFRKPDTYMDLKWCDHGGGPEGSCEYPGHARLLTPTDPDQPWEQELIELLGGLYKYYPGKNGGHTVDQNGNPAFDVDNTWLGEPPSAPAAMIGGFQATLYGVEYPGGKQSATIVTPIYGGGKARRIPNDATQCQIDWIRFLAAVATCAALAAVGGGPLDPFFLIAVALVVSEGMQLSKDGCYEH